MIPAWEVPMPISSSAQIIPSDAWPRIFAFLISKGSPVLGYKVAPTVATTTFCPAATFEAPQTICEGCSCPISTVVRLNLSASGCLTQVSTSPITIPSKPPGKDTKGSRCSTSSPDWVSSAAISSGLSFKKRYSLSLLIDIFIGH